VALFPLELRQAFPDAKIVITTRDENGWLRSMESTLVYARESNRAKPTGPRQELTNSYHLYCWGDDFAANGRHYWRDHMQMLKEAFPEDEALYFEVKSGWQPLCEFLNKPVPDQPFPRADDWKDWKAPAGWKLPTDIK
jgi:hypothetical protein